MSTTGKWLDCDRCGFPSMQEERRHDEWRRECPCCGFYCEFCSVAWSFSENKLLRSGFRRVPEGWFRAGFLRKRREDALRFVIIDTPFSVPAPLQESLVTWERPELRQPDPRERLGELTRDAVSSAVAREWGASDARRRFHLVRVEEEDDGSARAVLPRDAPRK